MIEKFRLTSAKPVSTPMEPNTYFLIKQSPSTHKQVSQMQGVPYREAIGCILWPAVVSRLDITFAVGILSQFIQNPEPVHWEAVKWVIVYLGTMKNLWLTFGGKSETLVKGYCDVDWASQKHRHLILGYSFHFRQGAISWSSKKHNIIALSSTKAEYITQMHAAKEAMWMKSFLEEIWELQWELIRVSCDNQGAIVLVKDSKFHSWMKHIDLCYHFIREVVKDGRLMMKYIPTEKNVSDIFTKALTWPKFVHFVERLGLREFKKESDWDSDKRKEVLELVYFTDRR